MWSSSSGFAPRPPKPTHNWTRNPRDCQKLTTLEGNPFRTDPSVSGTGDHYAFVYREVGSHKGRNA